MPTLLSSETMFVQALRASAPLVVVLFTAPWCGPCKALSRALPALEEEFSGVVFCTVNVEHLTALADACSITRVPTTLLFRPSVLSDAQPLTRVTGADLNTLRAALRTNL